MKNSMIRVNTIIHHPFFIEEVSNICNDEENRIYCKHDMDHSLTVARLMMIISNEEGHSFSKEHIYAAALLHDIGRSHQYRKGTPHVVESAKIASVILPECGFLEEEINQITSAILSHSGSGDIKRTPFGRILYIADKKSRPCFACSSEKNCNWKKEKKNLEIEY